MAGIGTGRAASCLTFPVEPDQLREVPFGNEAPGIVPRRRAVEVDGAVPGLLPNWRDLRHKARRCTVASADLYAVEISCWGQMTVRDVSAPPTDRKISGTFNFDDLS